MRLIPLLMIVCMVGLSDCAYSQPFKFGLHVSPTISYAEIGKSDARMRPVEPLQYVGLAGGVFAAYDFNRFAGIESGFSVVSKGYAFGYLPNESITRTDKTVVEVPLRLNLRLWLWPDACLKMTVGGAIDFNSGSRRLPRPVDSIAGKALEPNLRHIDVMNIYLITGLGFEHRLRNGNRVMFGVSYRNGFRDVTVGTLSYKMGGRQREDYFIYDGSYAALELHYTFGKPPPPRDPFNFLRHP